MTSEEIAIEFSKCYPDLLDYTKKALWHFRCPIDPLECLAECYLHIEAHKALLGPHLPVAAMSKNWIKQNIMWTNSPIKGKLARPVLTHTGPDPYTEYLDVDPEALISAWRATLTPYERRLWNIYGEQGVTRGREISLHFGISMSSAYLLIKEAKVLALSLKAYITKNSYD